MGKATKRAVIIVPVLLIVALLLGYVLFPGVTFHVLVTLERRIAGLEAHAVDAGGIHMAYLQGGQGEPLLLIHGFGANKDNWTRIGRHLTPHFRVIALDLPGFGESTRDPGADYTIPAQVERVRSFVRALKLERFHLGGNSMGGAISGTYAARYRDDVMSLWLIAPGGVASAEPSEMKRISEAGRPMPLIAESEDDYERLLDFVFVKRPFIPSAIKRYLAREAASNSPLNREIFKQIRHRGANPPLESLLKGLSTRTLILWGARDRVLHVSGAKILESIMPRAEAVILEDVGHVPMIERPREAAQAYLSFLGRVI